MSEEDANKVQLSLRLIMGEEEQRMVAAWPAVPPTQSKTRRNRLWALIANVALVRANRIAESLISAGICRPDGTVEPTAARFVTAAPLTRALSDVRKARGAGRERA